MSQGFWFPDSEHVLVCGNEPSKPFRCYRQDLRGGLPQTVTPDGIRVLGITPDGKMALVAGPAEAVSVLSLGDGSMRALSGMTSDDLFAGWTRDGRFLFVHRANDVPARLDRIDMTTGQRTFVREVGPPDRAGIVLINPIRIVADGRGYV